MECQLCISSFLPEYIVSPCVALVCLVALAGGIIYIFCKRYVCVCLLLCVFEFHRFPFFPPQEDIKSGPAVTSRTDSHGKWPIWVESIVPCASPFNEGAFCTEKLLKFFLMTSGQGIWNSSGETIHIYFAAFQNYKAGLYKHVGNLGRIGNLSSTT